MRIAFFLIFLFLVLSSPVFSADEIYTKYFSDKAVKGYDVVTYFQDSGPKKGKAEHRFEYKDAVWYFTSEENKALFVKDPIAYAPQYGGYCAWAVGANNALAPGDPLQYSLVEGKLYLNYDVKVKSKWLEDIQGFIMSADENWPGLID